MVVAAAAAAGFIACLFLPPPAGMSEPAWRVAAVTLLMVALWITEALPLPVTSLLPLALFPLLQTGSLRETAAPYADPIIFLFLGGFVLGQAMQKWHLHRRIGLRILLLVGTTPKRLVAGFLIASGFLSMWVSNSATAIMMLPVATMVAALFDSRNAFDSRSQANLGTALVLAVAYGASIGGLGTLVGSPPNALLAAYLAREHGIAVGFAQWMAVCLPLVVLLGAAAWLVLIRLHPVSESAGAGDDIIVQELGSSGPMTAAERRVAVIFAITALAWVTRPLYGPFVPGLEDPTIAVLAAIALFSAPSGMKRGQRLLVWKDLRGLPWDVLILFGGGLSLAAAIGSSGLAAWVGSHLALVAGWPLLVVVLALTLVMIFFTEVTSNTASAATFLPLGGALALAAGADPVLLTVPLALAASCGFMMPVGTPPNAIAFATGRVTMMQMARAGLYLNIIATALIVLVSFPLVRLVFGP